MNVKLKVFLLSANLFVATAFAQSYSLGSSTVAGGGGASTGGGYSLGGSVGQPGASLALSGGSFSLSGGFWSLDVVPPIPPAGLVAWWRAENDPLDAIGTNNGVLVNGTTFGVGKVGQAFSFDGVNDYIQVADAPALRPASVTLEAWVNMDSLGGVRNIIGKAGVTSGLDSYSLWATDGVLKGAMAGASGYGPFLIAPFALQTGRWHHVAYSFDDGSKQQTLYVDGNRVASGMANQAIAYQNDPVFLGGETQSGNPVYFLHGRIDEASIYNRALGASEIAAVYNAGSLGKPVPTSRTPQLTISFTAPNAVIVSWPSPSTGYSLQQNTNLKTANWVAPSESITDNGTSKFIIVNPPAGDRYYRLSKP